MFRSTTSFTKMAQTTISSYGEESKYTKPIKRNIELSQPFRCCYELTKRRNKKISYKGLEYRYDVWYCNVCKKEYIDTTQAKKIEKFLIIEKMLEDKLISIKRKMNFDGKTFFFRFPKELTGNWSKGSVAEIKVINAETFLVGIKSDDTS